MTATRYTVTAAVAPLLGDARIAASLTSQLLAGEGVDVLEARDDWRRVRGPDGYEGWTHVGYLGPTRGDEHTWRIALHCDVRLGDGPVYALPLGARLRPELSVVSGTAIDATQRAGLFPKLASALVTTALTRFAGASYVWAGVTPWGVDCSGLVQRTCALHGMALPRDAWQQAEATRRVHETADGPHAAGDLLFFSDRDDRRITHVGMATGDGHMVHSALRRGGVVVERLDDLADDYVRVLHAQCVGVHRLHDL